MYRKGLDVKENLQVMYVYCMLFVYMRARRNDNPSSLVHCLSMNGSHDTENNKIDVIDVYVNH